MRYSAIALAPTLAPRSPVNEHWPVARQSPLLVIIAVGSVVNALAEIAKGEVSSPQIRALAATRMSASAKPWLGEISRLGLEPSLVLTLAVNKLASVKPSGM